MADTARKAAFEAVARVKNGAYSNLIKFDSFDKKIDRAFAESIFLTTVEHMITLEHIAEKYIKRNTKPELYALILTGLCQLFYFSKVPQSAACDETTDIAKEMFGYDAGRFVNAVMRNCCREKNEILNAVENGEEYIKYSVNKNLFDLIKSQYPDKYTDIFTSFFGKQKCFLRINTLKTNAIFVAKKVNGKAITDKTVECDASNAIKFINGNWFFVQGYGSQQATEMLQAESGDTVVDVCACPGGKSLSAALIMKNKGKIYSFDIHKNKLPLIEASANKLGISIINAEMHDARSPKNELIGLADRVICDVPCSGIGEIGAKPEIRYKNPDDFTRLYETQRQIALSSSEYLKQGGIMVYSTCSINKYENEEVVRYLINSKSNLVSIYEHTLLPSAEIPEGFYINVIKRVG